MLEAYNTNYMAIFKRYRDILDTLVTITVKPPTGNERLIFRCKAVINSREYFDKLLNENIGEVTFFIDELKELKDIKDTTLFPLNDVEKRVENIRYSGTTYSVARTRKNMFDNIIVFELSRKL